MKCRSKTLYSGAKKYVCSLWYQCCKLLIINSLPLKNTETIYSFYLLKVQKNNFLKRILPILFLIKLSIFTGFCQVLNDQCNGPTIGSGSLYLDNMKTVGCVPFTVKVVKTDEESANHQYIYDYKGGIPSNLMATKTHTYAIPGAYKMMQTSFRKDNGQELRVCVVITVLDTNKLDLKTTICGNKVNLDIIDVKKTGLLPYDFCFVDWGDGSIIEKINLPTNTIFHNYANQNDRKISVIGSYIVSNCGGKSDILVKFPKVNQPQITILEKTAKDNFSLSFNNFSGENVKILANNVVLTTKKGEIGLQKIVFTNQTKNICYAIQLESACFSNNISKEICDIDFELIPTETANELKWKQPKPEVIKDFVLLKNTENKLANSGNSYSDASIICNQQNCYQISFRSNESLFISEKICLQNSLIKCFVNLPLYLPLAFSPNNDGINDSFEVFGEKDKFISLSIFERSGKRIKLITNPNEVWDGENYISGIYPYILKAKNITNNEVEVFGKVLLLR